MYVNGFWLGLLIGMVVMLVFFITLAHFSAKREEENRWQEYQPTEKEFQEILEQVEGKKFRVTRKDGCLVGELVEDEKDESENQ